MCIRDRFREGLRNERTEEIKNDSKPETEDPVVVLPEKKTNGNKENTKDSEVEPKKVRRTHLKNLIKTPEEWEIMNNGLINVLNIPITNNEEIMNARDYRRRLKAISIMTYHKTIVYNLEKTRDKWEIPEIEIRGKISMISLIIDGPVTYCFNQQYDRMSRISFAANERIRTGRMKYKEEARDAARKEIIKKTMVVRTIRSTEIMDPG